MSTDKDEIYATPEMVEAGVEAYARWLCQQKFDVNPDTWRDQMTHEQYMNISQGIEKAYMEMRRIKFMNAELKIPLMTNQEMLDAGMCPIDGVHLKPNKFDLATMPPFAWISNVKYSWYCTNCKTKYRRMINEDFNYCVEY